MLIDFVNFQDTKLLIIFIKIVDLPFECLYTLALSIWRYSGAKEQTRLTFSRYAKYDCGLDWDGRTDSAEYDELARQMNAVIGTPDQVAEQLLAWQADSGFDEIMCQVYAAGMRHADSLRSIELLGREVLRRIQSNLAGKQQA